MTPINVTRAQTTINLRFTACLPKTENSAVELRWNLTFHKSECQQISRLNLCKMLADARIQPAICGTNAGRAPRREGSCACRNQHLWRLRNRGGRAGTDHVHRQSEVRGNGADY